MLPLESTQPIGIFDSGIGGLTVARAVAELLPNENIIYFGDTAHLPYGDKSTATIQSYSLKICDMLLHRNCKTILIACHSASAAAYELVHEHVGARAIIVNVTDPVIEHLRENYGQRHIGLIGTRQTINSNIYKKKIDALDLGIKLSAMATPLLAPIIEEGFSNHKILAEAVHMYLSSPNLAEIDALILGCTHYPLIKKTIHAYYGNKVQIIDSAALTATALKKQLETHNLLNHGKKSSKQFYVSERTSTFETSTRLFFQEEIQLEHYPLWE
jgi:glutamate racemase